MASFGGAGIFGSSVSMATSEISRGSQVNSFFGINGLESLDGGFRGRITRVSGVLYGTSATQLAAAEGTFRLYHDGAARVLVDNLGTIWPSVQMLQYQPLGRIRQAANGTYFRAYQAQFLHLA